MLQSPQTENEANWAKSPPSVAAVREQLKRLLAHPLFTNSKRYPVLLAYTVEKTLLGHAHELKERTIGVEAFGREPSYDVNLDPVVRTTAAEVRKRLIQYYYNTDHTGELVIELLVGSYVPIFRDPVILKTALLPEAVNSENSDIASQDSLDSEIVPVKNSHPWTLFAACLLIALLVGFGAGRIRLPGRPTNMERFWEPITATSSRVTYCLGQPVDAVDRNRTTPNGMPLYGSLHVSDVITLARSVVPLVPKNGAFRVVSDSDIGFTQLREGPFVLIGAFDNVWTMRITQDLPFGFEVDSQVRKVVDRKSAQKRFWTLEWQVPYTKLAKDYAIVARIHDNVTGQPVIILAGILGEGTEAASEVVSNPTYLNAMLEKAPKNWTELNLEAVIETNVVDDHAGPPTVLAVETW
ncbi:hypothetical protein [Terracidiphilus sp.]|jgi:hypothetical protein|uniref:hypothetical protein n=1 Tax=Terracidiphilus sp. TaxID=1964191 RepID=UPI003C22910D